MKVLRVENAKIVYRWCVTLLFSLENSS
ncbi:hypothetical protein CY0110_19047 [Crocosphaera chwakensis CCY0110]|uniref:Uncharacterized protein n=1 Tax=Crocosphaera chwakensis CCY0110 TaxID=391612 RepID=A3IJE1_9CHRO|nr:hypothetical protein CY0110_19047 [Crocosphaera chwakensis CCY0110]